MTIPELTTEQVREGWNQIATGYDRYVTPTHAPLSKQALDRASLPPGARFLDVAAGSGSLSIPAARQGAEVVATDIAPKMVEALRARAREAGLTNLDARVMDGHDLEFDDDAFDAAASQFGVMLFPDLPRALTEMARVTRPGGRVLLANYGHPSRVEFLSFFTRGMKSVDPDFEGVPMDPLPLPFQASDPDTITKRFHEAGLEDVRVDTVTEELTFRSGREFWEWIMNSNPIPGMLVAGTTKEQRAAAVEALDELLRERAGDGDAAVLSNPVHIGVGTPTG